MPNAGKTRSSSITSARSSVRYRIVAGTVIMLFAFAGLTIYSIVLHRRTVAKISLINTSYLPLTYGTARVGATQLVFNTLMDRLADDPNQSVTREWIDAARRFRPSTLDALVSIASEGMKRGIPKGDAVFLKEMKKRLLEVKTRYIKNEGKFQELYNLMDTGRIDEARANIENLKRVERNLDRVLRGIGEEIDRHISGLNEEAEQDGLRAIWILALLTLVALVVTGAVTISINYLLAPLKTMEQAVAEVARGDLKTRIDVARDDEIGALAMGFNKMTEALAERDEMLIRSERLATTGKMAAQVTHEIRNPLSSLRLNAELLDEELGPGERHSEAKALLKAMQDEIERLTGITESYLRFARLPSPEPAFGDLNKAVENALDFMNGEMADLSINVTTELSENLDPVLFDPGQIRQALANLLLNACEAMPGGGSICVATKRTGEAVELTVSDTGGGVPAEALDHIFESFYSTKKSGTGLGLSLVRQICRAHGGDVRYEKRDGGGAAFIISLPCTVLGELKGAKQG